jgi:hypothetical protein
MGVLEMSDIVSILQAQKERGGIGEDASPSTEEREKGLRLL